MPLFEYRCDCGKSLEVLVRGGREPLTCDEAGEYCAKTGNLKRLISTISVGSGRSDAGYDGAMCESSGGEMSCGNCGRTPDTCDYN